MTKIRMKDVVVILPGITGSVLQKDGKDLWAASQEALWEALSTHGGSLQQLKLDKDDPEAEDLGDGIRATRLMPDAHLIPGLVKIDGYTEMSRLITDNFEVISGDIRDDKPANFFEFPYDWRRDNRATARILKRHLDQRLKQWREYTANNDAKVILLAHSMGGLISRYYLEVLSGWRDCKALFTFGTPYRGSVGAIDSLVNGYKQSFFDLTEVLRSLPSVYQLLPIYKMLKVGNEYHRIAEVDNLPYIVKQKAEDALKFHREIEEAVNTHLNDANYLRCYQTIPIVGTGQPTLQSANLVNGKITVSTELPEWIDTLLGDGDGTVPYLSAIPIELSTQYRETYFAERHGSLQNNSRILQQLRDRIKEMQVLELDDIRAPELRPKVASSAIAISLDDLYLPEEPVEIRAKLIHYSGNSEGLQARIAPVYREGAALQLDFEKQEQEWVLRVNNLAPGLYRLSVQTKNTEPQAPTPVHDLFAVAK